MKQTKIGIGYRLTADEGMWLTTYTDEQDILMFSALKQYLVTKNRISAYREITDAEKIAYEERKSIALAVDIETPTEE